LDAIQHILSTIGSAVSSLAVWLGLVSASVAPQYQGYVEGDYVFAAPAVGGKLVSVSVRRGDYAETGTALFAQDRVQEQAARDQAAAALQQSQDRLANLEKGRRPPEIRVIEAQIAQAKAQLQLSGQKLDRQQRLSDSAAFSRERYDEAIAEYDLQEAKVAELQAQLAAATMALGRVGEVDAARAEVAANRAALDQAQWRLDQRSVAAPVSGLVTDTYFDPGEYVGTGQAVVSILPPENRKVRFFVPERHLNAMAIGAKVTLRCNGCPSEIPAEIRYISPNAEYTPPVLYNRDNRERLLFMVEAYPVKDPEILRPGQPVDVIPATP